MNKNVLIISTSLRKDSNSDALAVAFLKGAQDAGNIAEKITLFDKKIQFCIGCLNCQTTKSCILKDDVNEIVQKMFRADVLAFATPVYFYDMSGQMKTLLDRSNPLFTTAYSFRDIYLLATAGDESPEAMDGTINGLQGWISCFEKANLAGVIRATGVTEQGDISKKQDVLTNAYNMGKYL